MLKAHTITLCAILIVLGIPLATAADYQYVIGDDWISLSDGTRLAVTYYRPFSDEVEDPGAKFPVLLEMLPYRKDDISRSSSHPNYDYFARQGLGMARVDIRGTGSSEGQTPSREYSDREIEDAIEVIAALAELPWSNGKVGMWGISWGGFNAIQVAMRKPPHLTAILAAHASDDLYKNDVHYNDGIFNIDEYMLSINHLNGFMQSPDYVINEEYFQQRFDREPWLFEVMRQSRDGDFWRDGSLRWHYDQIEIPVYLIGGLLDGYRDTLPRALENLDTPVRAILGPWPHAWPSSVTPGPSWEWRADASAWWRYWLLDDDSTNNNFDGQEFRVFLRDGGDVPDTDRETIAGKWLALDWPISAQDSDMMNLYPTNPGALSSAISGTNSIDTLNVVPGAGIDLGEWWGEQLGDMSDVDRNSLNYDSVVVTENITLLGSPSVTLMAAADSNHANWIVRLEDVHPGGQVSLITGGAINGAQRQSSLQPSELTPNEFVRLEVPLHFTTWTFKPGHRIRLAVSNSAFPMYWPSAVSSSSLSINDENSMISLPIFKADSQTLGVTMPEAEESNYLPSEIISFDAIEGRPSRSEVIEDSNGSPFRFVRESAVAYRLQHPVDINKTIVLESERHTQHSTSNSDGADSGFEAWAEYRLLPAQGRDSTIRYRTTIDLRSDADSFELEIERTLSDESGEIRSKQWRERFPREHQ